MTMGVPYKNLTSPGKNTPASNKPEVDTIDISKPQPRVPPLVNEPQTKAPPQHNPNIPWPAAEGPDQKPMKLTK